jgi:hypothetical protein
MYTYHKRLNNQTTAVFEWYEPVWMPNGPGFVWLITKLKYFLFSDGFQCQWSVIRTCNIILKWVKFYQAQNLPW